LHELGHAIGFYHEHNRYDRNDYINVNTANLDQGLLSQLRRIPKGESNTLGLGYDYASIMHYSSLRGIITPKSNVPFGNAEELSPLDIEKAQRLYRCGE
jgi:astacin